ncbi:hypothetical protein Nepgr_010281 [Nepenthes gracilis]|uniref:Uncharacterized protein n=1 Tax=Nepenthes gracilis TaxID=150966 RepID=A0AAD3SCT3_NEPGR|nr:hypothetical protein Nepgr_010281 [Nepenthes gracilis]
MSPLGGALVEGGFVFSAARDVLVTPAVEGLRKAWHTCSSEPEVRMLFQESCSEALDSVGVNERERVPQRWTHPGTIDGIFKLHRMREIWAPPWGFDYCIIGDGKRGSGTSVGVSCCFVSPVSLEFEQGSQGTAFGALKLRLVGTSRLHC